MLTTKKTWQFKSSTETRMHKEEVVAQKKKLLGTNELDFASVTFFQMYWELGGLKSSIEEDFVTLLCVQTRCMANILFHTAYFFS